MKKFIVAFLLIAGSAGYVLVDRLEAQANGIPLATTASASTDAVPAASAAKTTPVATSVVTTAPATPKTTTVPSVPAKPKGQYTDGTYVGSVADAYYGNIQVEAIISGGRLSNIRVLQYPNDRSTSIEINRQALPMLISEAISAQSANIDGISGASDTSPAFIESLRTALAKARA